MTNPDPTMPELQVKIDRAHRDLESQGRRLAAAKTDIGRARMRRYMADTHSKIAGLLKRYAKLEYEGGGTDGQD